MTYSRLKPPASPRGRLRLGLLVYAVSATKVIYNGAPLASFYDTLGIRRAYSRLNPLVPNPIYLEENHDFSHMGLLPQSRNKTEEIFQKFHLLRILCMYHI